MFDSLTPMGAALDVEFFRLREVIEQTFMGAWPPDASDRWFGNLAGGVDNRVGVGRIQVAKTARKTRQNDKSPLDREDGREARAEYSSAGKTRK